MKTELTYEEAHRLFKYDADTGKLYWRVNRRGGVKDGDEAGYVRECGRTKYRKVRLRGKQYQAHRVIWLMLHGTWPEGDIDHRDGDGLNNRPGNLRDVPGAVNRRNQRMNRNNTSGVNGVCWEKADGKWRAQSRIGSGKRKFLGRYDDIRDAERAVREFQASLGFTERHGKEAV